MRPFILILLAVIVLISCGKDEDPTVDTKLVGTWTGVSSTTEMKVDGKTYQEYLMETLGLSEEDAQVFVDMMEEFLTITGYFSEFNVKADGTYTAVTTFQGTSIDVAGTWQLNGQALTLTNNAEPGAVQTGTITKLDDSELWMEIIPRKEDLPAGTPTNIEYKVTGKFTRKK